MTGPRVIQALLSAGRDESEAFSAPGRQPLSYAGLRRHLGDSVRALQAIGVRRSDRIALALPNGPELACALLAVTGAAVAAPLNPAFKTGDFDFAFADLRVRALLVESGSDSEAVAAARRRLLPILELVPDPRGEAGRFSIRGSLGTPGGGGTPSPEDLALVVHTSGTTSRPKIVPRTHRKVCEGVLNGLSIMKLTEADRGLQFLPLFHSHGLIYSLLAPLAAGSRVHLAPDFNATRFFSWLEEVRPTWFTAVPAFLQAIAAQADQHPGLAARSRLRFIRSSSAPLPASLQLRLEEIFGVPVIEAYGLSESNQVTSNPLPPGLRKPGTVGVPVGNEIAILDPAGRVLPPGQEGEIGVRGGNVISCYENNPEADASSFVNGWFRTGDQGLVDEDGYLRITARIKEMINRGGEKISPREVDEALLAHPSVAQAVAFALPSETLGEDVAAAVVLRKGMNVGEAELRDHASRHLADFKVPRRFVFLDQLPTGPVGKPLRIGLAQKLKLSGGITMGRAPFVAPRTPLETEIAALWSRLLGVPQVGVDDNFFDLGGDSLSAAEVALEIESVMKVELPLAQMAKSPTVAGVALAIMEMQAKAAAPGVMERLLGELEKPGKETPPTGPAEGTSR